MKKLLAVVFCIVALTGCDNANEKKAQGLIDEVRGLWDRVMPYPPEDRGSSLKLNKDTVRACTAILGAAQNKLAEVAKDYSDTEAWKSEKTVSLNKAVTGQLGRCTELQHSQGW